MYIKSIELSKFIPFGLAQIRKLQATFHSQIQIFIGTNGSGKTSLLNELHPLPAIRSSYKKQGYKKLIVEHEGNEYILTSDFSDKTKAHSFIKNGEELNISHVSGIQSELVSTHLGYTPLVHNLTHFKYKMCQMGKTDRKNFLLAINPIDLTLVLKAHKQCCSKIRECKGNINLLSKRKQEIEDKLLSKDVLQEKYKQKEELEKQNTEISNTIFYLQEELNKYQQQFSTINKETIKPIDFQRLKKFENRVNIFLSEHKNIGAGDTHNKINTLSSDIGFSEATIAQLENQAASIVKELETYDKNILDMNAETSVSKIEETLKEKKNKFAKFKKITNQIVFIDDEYLSECCTSFTYLTNAINSLIDCHPKHIVTKDVFNKISSKLQILQYRKNNLDKEIVSLMDRIKECDDELNELPSDKFELIELCTTCDYRSRWQTSIKSLQEKKDKLKAKYQYSHKQCCKLDSVYTKLSYYYNEQSILRNFVENIKSILSKMHYFNNTDTYVTEKLNDNPIKFMKDIEKTILIQPTFREQLKLEKEILEIEQNIKTLNKTQTPVVHILQEMYKNKTKELLDIQTQLKRKDKELSLLMENKKNYEYLDKIRNTAHQLEKEIAEYEQYVTITKTIEYINLSLNEFNTKRNQINCQLGTIATVLKEQESLLNRYNEEIVKLLEKSERDKLIYETMEFGLSPITGFPHQQLIKHLNVMIRNVNVLVNQIWSYPLQIVELDPKEPFDYTFQVLAKDELVPDISNLSKGQMAIVDIAWMVVSLLTMGLTKYPVFLDECSDGLDPVHSQRLLEWLKEIADEKYVNQMFIINHDAALYSGFSDAETLCLMGNEELSEHISHLNQHVKFS
mgnify:FL=1|jgi:energy-coupling factor transporter ATP-binding protein EcfA2